MVQTEKKPKVIKVRKAALDSNSKPLKGNWGGAKEAAARSSSLKISKGIYRRCPPSTKQQKLTLWGLSPFAFDELYPLKWGASKISHLG